MKFKACDASATTASVHGDQNLECFSAIPPGFKFSPTDEELIMAYLRKKVNNEALEPNQIAEAEVYRCNPERICKEYKSANYGEQEWYFFSPTRYSNRMRPKVEDGYWRSSSMDTEILSNGIVVGHRNTLSFYEGKPPNYKKTNWIMHEYKVVGPSQKRKTGVGDKKLNDWVLCKIHKNVKN